MKKRIFLLLLVAAASIHVSAATRFVTATDEHISFTGRVLHNSNGSVSFDWTGVYMQVAFSGRQMSVRIAESDTAYYNVFIDGRWKQKVKMYGKESHDVLLADGLRKGWHTLCLQRCTEGEYSRTTIDGISIDQKAELKKVAPKKRFIEVYGDSYTCGFGVESNRAEDPFRLETENCNDAYACIIARYFDADYALTAHSGMGMVRNWGDAKQVSDENMSHRALRVMDKDASKAYAFNRHRPDIVLINLGTNDFSPVAIPTPEQYAGAYVKLIQTLREHYGEVPVLCIEPHSANAYLHTALQEVQRRTVGMPKVFFANSLQNMVTEQYDMGADWHPNYQGQRKIASCLIPQISAIMSWALEDKVIK
jgi:lysophospholipase L1-like esterase